MATGRKIVSHAEWISARRQLLVAEKDFTRRRDRLSQLRRELPWQLVDTDYVFDGPKGRESLADLFEGRTQLIIYHFMFAPSWEAGCPHCSFWADNFNDIIVHLNQRDVTMVAVSRAPYAKLSAYQQRMGWDFTWVSSGDGRFNYDYQVTFTDAAVADKAAAYNYATQAPEVSDREGVSVFAKGDDGGIFHTYSTFARGIDLLNTAYNYLDLVPKGRDEGGRGPFWVRRHDEYGRT
jgi:predicted dithiol-disulfide oxidoreductase (DUF899 family)